MWAMCCMVVGSVAITCSRCSSGYRWCGRGAEGVTVPVWLQILTTILAVIFTAFQGVAAVMSVIQTRMARKRDEAETMARRDREDKEESQRKEDEQSRELHQTLEKALAIHRESTDSRLLEERFKDIRTQPEVEHLRATRQRLQLASDLLEERMARRSQMPSSMIAKTILDLVQDALKALTVPVNEDAHIPDRIKDCPIASDSLIAFQQAVSESFDVGKMHRILGKRKLSTSDGRGFFATNEDEYRKSDKFKEDKAFRADYV